MGVPIIMGNTTASGWGTDPITVNNATPTNLSLTSSVANQLLGMAGQSAQDAATEQAQQEEAQGLNSEANSYGAATQIADQNAALEQALTSLYQFQNQRQVANTVGTQIATVAANGLKEAGTPAMMLKSSLQQGYLSNQLIATQGAISQGSYLEQAAASTGEQAAATSAASAATTLGTAAGEAGQIANANATAEATALNSYLNGLPGSNSSNGFTAPDTSSWGAAPTISGGQLSTGGAASTPEQVVLSSLTGLTGPNTATNLGGLTPQLSQALQGVEQTTTSLFGGGSQPDNGTFVDV